MSTQATTAAVAGHAADCMCVKCMMADMDATLAANGLAGDAYAIVETATAERTRYAKPGQACGRGVVRKASPAQVALIRRLMAERDTRNLVRLPGSEDLEDISLKGASDLIDRLQGCPKLATATPANLATDAQVRFAMSLVERKLGLVKGSPEYATAEANVKAMDRRRASQHIDTLKGMADAPKSEAAKAAEVTEGMYRDPATGDIFKVQRAVHGSGNLYAKKLVELEEPTVKRGKEHRYGFDYAAGAMRHIQAAWKMSLEEAKEWGQLYGVCCNCGATLTDEGSIAAGIGPVCATKF